MRILAYVERRMGIDGVLKIKHTLKRSNLSETQLYMNCELIKSTNEIEGSFSCIMANSSFGLHPGLLARRCPNSPRIYALTCFSIKK